MDNSQAAHRAPGPYWVRLNPDEKWTIARFDLTIAHGEPGWLLFGLPCPLRVRGDEETRAIPEPVSN